MSTSVKRFADLAIDSDGQAPNIKAFLQGSAVTTFLCPPRKVPDTFSGFGAIPKAFGGVPKAFGEVPKAFGAFPGAFGNFPKAPGEVANSDDHDGTGRRVTYELQPDVRARDRRPRMVATVMMELASAGPVDRNRRSAFYFSIFHICTPKCRPRLLNI